MPPRMHFDEVDTDASLVSRLLAAQFPQWAELPIEPIESAGTDNAIYRLGDDMAVRLPRREGATAQVENEHHWLPQFAPFLPLTIPTPLAMGMPGEGYPWHWAVCRWLAGENAVIARIADLNRAATVMAQFIAALQRIDTTGGPPPGDHNFNRGVPLGTRDAFTRAGIASLPDSYDKDALTAVWEATLRLPVWDGPPVWIHGDLQAGNVLVERGKLHAVIDFGGLCVGDPACDLMVAWNILSAESRAVFRAALPPVDEATWARGRGWSLSVWVGGVAYYAETFPMFSQMAAQAIGEVLADYGDGE